MKRFPFSAFVLVFAFAALHPVPAQDALSNIEARPSEPFPSSAAGRSWDDASVFLVASGGLQLASVLESFGYSEAWFPPSFMGTLVLQHLPAIGFGTESALSNAGLQLGLTSAWAANAYLLRDSTANALLFNAAHKYSMYATYDAYARLRASSPDADYAVGFAREGFWRLAAAPFDARVMGDWYLWGYLATRAAIAAGMALTTEAPNAVWKTGKAYIGRAEFPILAGAALVLLLQTGNFVMTGIGEEALYRGSYYAEMKYRFGEWPAKVADAAYFTLSHYPQKWDSIAAAPLSDTALSFLASAGTTFWLQYVYEWGGLRSAVAAHAWTDVIVFFADWLLRAGVPYDEGIGFSINSRLLELSLTLPL